jgi:hypothetical protein
MYVWRRICHITPMHDFLRLGVISQKHPVVWISFPGLSIKHSSRIHSVCQIVVLNSEFGFWLGSLHCGGHCHSQKYGMRASRCSYSHIKSAFGLCPEQPDQIVGMTKKLANHCSARNSPTVGEKIHCNGASWLGQPNFRQRTKRQPDMTYLPIFW